MKSALQQQFIRFLLIGTANTALTYGLYLWLLTLMEYRYAYSISFAAGVMINFFLQTRFVFETQRSWGKLLRYPLVYVVQYLFGLGVITLAVQVFNLPTQWAMLCAIILSIPITFLISRWVLRDPAKSE